MSTRKVSKPQLRLRVFAGPNGSGKSTIIKEVQSTVLNGKPIDFGFYINADDITQALIHRGFSFGKFKLKSSRERLISFAQDSGLISDTYPLQEFSGSFQLKGSKLLISKTEHADRIGQIVARFLREEMLRLKRRFTFETVFSHPSNLDIMKRAISEGYKVYLYFVTTESPEINIYRVSLRVKQGGHHVPQETIKNRYFRSLNLLKEAAEIAYQAFFFDNSKENEPFRLVAHFKKLGDKKIWDKAPNGTKTTRWFKKYYRS